MPGKGPYFESLGKRQWVISQVFPGGATGKEPACQCRIPRRHGFDPWHGPHFEKLCSMLFHTFFFLIVFYLSQLLVSVTASIVFLFLSLIGSSDSSFLWCWLWLTGKLLSAGLENSLLFPVKAAYQENVLNFIKCFSSNYCDNHVFFFLCFFRLPNIKISWKF